MLRHGGRQCFLSCFPPTLSPLFLTYTTPTCPSVFHPNPSFMTIHMTSYSDINTNLPTSYLLIYLYSINSVHLCQITYHTEHSYRVHAISVIQPLYALTYIWVCMSGLCYIFLCLYVSFFNSIICAYLGPMVMV